MRTRSLVAPPRATSLAIVPAGIVPVLGVTCTTPECGFHESLHTSDPAEAVRTARELGWRLKGVETLCPLCVECQHTSLARRRTSRANGRRVTASSRQGGAK